MKFKFSSIRVGFAIFMYMKNHKNTMKQIYDSLYTPNNIHPADEKSKYNMIDTTKFTVGKNKNITIKLTKNEYYSYKI